MRWLILTGISCLVGLADVHAQVPGFMGKRFALFLEPNLTPALFVQNVNNTVMINPGGDQARTEKNNLLSINYRPQITLEYLVTRDVSLGFSYSVLQFGTPRRYETASSQPGSPQYEIDFDVVRGRAAGMHFKFYKFRQSASIAPIGFYKTISIYFSQTNTYDDKKSTVKQFKNDFLYPVVCYGIGRQTMIAKNFILKTGVDVGWAMVPINYLQESEEEWTVQEYAGYNVHGSLLGYYLFNITLSFGYIPF
jgi:hypothetical protein